jgi:hypothetical protein
MPFGKAVSQRAAEGGGWLTWVLAGDESRIEEWLESELAAAIGSDVEVEWVAESANDGDSGIVDVHVITPSGVVRLD